MTTGERLTAAAVSAPTGADRARRRGLIALCATEITSWGVLYYAFPVLMGGIGADTGWSATTVMGGFSVGLAVSAVAGVPVGRLLDRWGPRPVMTAGSVLGVVSVVAIATADSPLWYIAAWALSGIAQAGVFYKPAFAAITGWYGPSRIRPLTTLTLVAGLSSTVFAPLTAVLADRTDWRTTYLVLAVVLAVVTVPAHAVFLKVPWHPETRGPATGGGGGVMRSRPFVLLTVAMALATFGMFAATVNLVPLLTAHDASTGFAAWALGLCGAGQLLGRVGYGRFSAATGVRARTVTVLAAGGLTIAVTAVAAGPTIGLMAAVIVFGATRGTLTLLEATAVSDRWGTGGFGALYGAYSAPATVAMAMTPWVGAVLTDWIGGYRPLFLASAAIVLLAAVFAVWSVPATSRRDAGSA